MKITDTLTLKLPAKGVLFVISDVHLGPDYSQEVQQLTDQTLAEQVQQLQSHDHAALVLNGDIFELWKYPDAPLTDIMAAVPKLTAAIAAFSEGTHHQVIFTVGNHDDRVAWTAADRENLHKLWGAQACLAIELKQGDKTIRMEHGHQFDPYNRTVDPFDPQAHAKGKKITQHTLPLLHRYLPRLTEGLDDVIDRQQLPVFGVSRFFYRFFLPYVTPVLLLMGLTLGWYTTSWRYLVGVAVGVIALWLLCLLVCLVAPWLIRHVFGNAGDIDETTIEKYLAHSGYDGIVVGHTHRGMILQTPKGWYANSGCNDPVQLLSSSWLGVPVFQHYRQNSNLTLQLGSHIDVQYQQVREPLLDATWLERLAAIRKPQTSSISQAKEL